jgi:hypothetical protein
MSAPLVEQIAATARALRSAVVVTFDPNADSGRGMYRVVVDDGASADTATRTWLQPAEIIWTHDPARTLAGLIAPPES